MTKYSAADFANAKFAEHPCGGRGHMTRPGKWRLSSCSQDFSTEQLVTDGWVPVPTKPTIAESELEEACGTRYESDDFFMGFIRGFEKAGGTVLEETTRERVARLVNEAVGGRGIVPVGEKVADRLINLGLVKDN